MTALTQDRDTPYREGVELDYDVAADAKIYAGGMVCKNASGYAVPGADTASFVFLGVARQRVDNTGGSDGDKKVVVRRTGIHRFAASGMAITDIGEQVYISDDQTVAKSSTNSIACGRIAEFISATEVGVDIAK
jgi:hypothetical protein